MPGGAIRNAIFRRSAASATSGVESSPKATERDCCFTPPENHGIDEKKLEISLLHTEMCRSNVERSDAGALIIIIVLVFGSIADGARYRVRTCDPYRVKVVLYH